MQSKFRRGADESNELRFCRMEDRVQSIEVYASEVAPSEVGVRMRVVQHKITEGRQGEEVPDYQLRKRGKQTLMEIP
jgi:hypothetical protein